MEIIANQHLWIDYAMSYKSRIELNNLTKLVDFIRESMDASGLNITDELIFCVDEMVSENETNIIGLEFIIPVDRQMPSDCQYFFKPIFRLDNAIFTKYIGKLNGIEAVKKAMREYAVNHNETILTGVYFRIKQLDGDNAVLEAFMGVSGNAL